MSRAKIAVLQFPGLNCEAETARALAWAGVRAEIVRWNERGARLGEFAGFVIPGGFSYQDRVRAGAIVTWFPDRRGVPASRPRSRAALHSSEGMKAEKSARFWNAKAARPTAMPLRQYAASPRSRHNGRRKSPKKISAIANNVGDCGTPPPATHPIAGPNAPTKAPGTAANAVHLFIHV